MSGSREPGAFKEVSFGGQPTFKRLARELHDGGSTTSAETTTEPTPVEQEPLPKAKRGPRASIPEGLPELPPSILNVRPSPAMMPRRRPSQVEVRFADDTLTKSPEPSLAETEPEVEQAQSLGGAALEATVTENQGADFVHPPQAAPEGETQA